MKSLLLAPALVSFVNTDLTVESSDTKPLVTELVAIAKVEDNRPIVELPIEQPFVEVAVEQEVDEERLRLLQAEMEDLANDLEETRGAVENVAKERDQAREEVRALANANHEMLKEMKTFREEMERARAEAAKWKAEAVAMEKKTREDALALVDMKNFRAEVREMMGEFRAMKEDLAEARTELQDPIERANLKEELAEARAKQERLGDEVEMALIAREKTILESARTKKELEGKMETLMQQAQEANQLRDELRSVNAGKMKALADVEVLRKTLQKSEEAQEVTLAELKVAQDGLLALQAEKAAAVEARMQVMQERDEALAGMENLQERIEQVRAEAETSRLQAVQERDEALAGMENLRVQIEQVRAEAETSRMQVVQERDEALAGMESLRGQIEEVRAEAEASRQAVAEMTDELQEIQLARETTGAELAETAGTLEKAQEEVVFLTKAKGGLEELLFKKTAEIRKLKGELRKVHASREKGSKPPKSPESEGRQDEEEGKPDTAQALVEEE